MIRAAVGIGAFAALVAVNDNDPALGLAFAGGAGIVAVAALQRSMSSRHYAARKEAAPRPDEARREDWWRIAVRAAWPSTIGLAVLIAISAPIEPTVSALLAGCELGLAIMSLLLGAENALWERRAGVVVEYAPGPKGSVFVRPRRSVSTS